MMTTKPGKALDRCGSRQIRALRAAAIVPSRDARRRSDRSFLGRFYVWAQRDGVLRAEYSQRRCLNMLMKTLILIVKPTRERVVQIPRVSGGAVGF